MIHRDDRTMDGLDTVYRDRCRSGVDHPPLWLQSRPFGVALLVAGWDDDGPVL